MTARLAALLALCALAHNGISEARQLSRIGETARASCSSYEHRCRNGQCISNESVCDGLVDCLDGSDETREQCSNGPECNPRAFRCFYGACIDGGGVCNGVKDCADNSDESGCSNSGGSGGGDAGSGEQRPPGGSCRSGQFRCDNGECIDGSEACDGNIDCLDKSDETLKNCQRFSCPDYVFRCAYGACIDLSLRCNGQVNCADGSDESRGECSSEVSTPDPWPTPSRPTTNPYQTNKPRPTQRPTTNPYETNRPRPTTSRPTTGRPTTPTLVKESCPVPEQPEHGSWHLEPTQCRSRHNCQLQQGERFLEPGSQLVYSCYSGYRLNGSEDVFCSRQGKWSQIPTCDEIMCPSLFSTEREALQCTTDKGWVSCDSPMPPRTTAKLKCRAGYSVDPNDLTRSDNVQCNDEGQWEPKPLKCVPDCGVATTGQGTPLIVNGTIADVSEFPWHGTLYKAKGKDKQFICGATIIKTDLFITAAHCVYDEGNRRFDNPSKYYVSAGNVWRDWDYEENNVPTVQKARVKNIFHVCNYIGQNGNYESDIAILQIDRVLQFSAVVKPVCLDTASASDQVVLEPGNMGKVAGFGRTASGESSFILQALSVPYVSSRICRQSASDSVRFLTIDKFCAGYTNGSSVCDGDSGGGLVFQTDNRWYLRGIVSVGIGAKEDGAVRICNSYAFSLYSRVSSHMDWIQTVILNLENNRPIPACS